MTIMLTGVAGGSRRAQTVDDLFQAYSAGRFDEVVSSVEKRFQAQADVDRFVRELRRARGTRRPETVAALALEAAAVHWRRIYLYPATFGATPEAARDLFELGCSTVRQKADPDFAIRWHTAAIALLTGPPDERWGQSTVSVRAHDVLEAHHGHLDRSLRANPRIALAWGVSRDILVQRVVNDRGDARGWARAAFAALDVARSDAALAPEATLRLGLIRFHEGRTDEALSLWATVPALTRDASMRYLALMLRGRAFAAAGRSAEAVDTFRSALALKPGAQSAQAPLAALLFAAGHRDEAVALAQTALAQTTPAGDPWWTYLDARWPAHLSALREAAK